MLSILTIKYFEHLYNSNNFPKFKDKWLLWISIIVEMGFKNPNGIVLHVYKAISDSLEYISKYAMYLVDLYAKLPNFHY